MALFVQTHRDRVDGGDLQLSLLKLADNNNIAENASFCVRGMRL